MSLHVHHGPHLGPLIEILAKTLVEPLPDPFVADVISVPTAGMRDWLQQQLALRLGVGVDRAKTNQAKTNQAKTNQAKTNQDGVAANISMVFPSRFTAAALGRHLESSSPWDIERLTWTVLAALETGEVDVPGWRAPGRISRHGAYATARRIADLFDRYANNRPQLLQQWSSGHAGDGTTDDNDAIVPLPDDQAWQPQLWRRVRAAIGTPNPAEQLPGLLADLREGRIEPQLPARVAVFGVSGVSATHLGVLQSLGAVRDVHLFLVHPSPAAWTASRQQLGGRLVPRSACDATAAVEHPLLRSWGRPAMEAAVLVGGLDSVVEAPPNPLASGHDVASGTVRTLLHQIQADLITDTVPTASIGAAPGVAAPDTSLQIHACHGTVRQLEVLRDALGHIFASDHSLTAHDVVVLCPDLARFAPLVQSVFHRSALPIPVRVTDLSLGTGNPVAAGLTAVLETISGRCTGPEILSLCSLEPVRRTFGFDDDSIERIERWMNELGVSWGLDSEHRSRWIPESIAEGTWASTMDRILLGAAMPAPLPRVGPSEVVPFDDVDSGALVTAGQLGEVLDRLMRLRSVTTEMHTIEAWIGVLTDVVNSLMTTAPADAWQTIDVMETIAEIGRHACPAGASPNAVPLALNDIRSLLAGVLGQQHGRLNLRSGAVTVTAMVPVRNIPARVVCVLGLDEGTLRATGGDGDDVLGARPCVGERDPRTEGRHLLLDALMTAGDHFIITCDGSDITTNRKLPLPVLIEELLDIVRASRPTMGVVRRHPRQAYDESNFGVDRAGAAIPAFSFDRGMLAAAEIRRGAPARAAQLALLSEVIPASVTIAQLAEGSTRPARSYLQQRLDVRLPHRVEEVETDIPLVVGGLESWQLANELLDHYRRGGDEDALRQWRDAKRRSGILPPRALADAALDEVERELGVLLKAPPNLRELLTVNGSVDVDIRIQPPNPDAPAVRLSEVIEHVAEDLLVRVVFSRPKSRHAIAVALELAALVVAEPARAWRALYVTRGKSGPGSATELQPIEGHDRGPAARRFLETVLAIHLRALREPIPMFEKSSRALYDTANFEDEEFESDLQDNHTGFLWGDSTPDEILAIPLRTDELKAVATIAATTACTGGGRAHAFARFLWTAYDEFIAHPVAAALERSAE